MSKFNELYDDNYNKFLNRKNWIQRERKMALKKASAEIDSAQMHQWQKNLAKTAYIDLPENQAVGLMNLQESIGVKNLFSRKTWNKQMSTLLAGSFDSASLQMASGKPSAVRPYFRGALQQERQKGITCSNYYMDKGKYYIKIGMNGKNSIQMELGKNSLFCSIDYNTPKSNGHPS